MPLRQTRHAGYLRGLNASTSYPQQPPRTVARVSNMTLNTRGALRSCDQNVGICTYQGLGPSSTKLGPMVNISFFQPSTSSRKVLSLWRNIITKLAVPSSLSAVAGGSGGSLATGTYYYVVTALDGAGGETTESNEVSVGVTLGQEVTLSWTAVPLAYGYNVYRGTTAGGEMLLAGVGLPTMTNSFIDTGAASGTAYPLNASPNGATVFTKIIPGVRGSRVIWWLQFYPTSITPFENLPLNTPFTATGVTASYFDGSWLLGGIGPNYIQTTIQYTTPPAPNGTTGGGGDIILGGSGGSYPTQNTTQVLSLIDTSNLSFDVSSVIKNFPTGPYQPIPAFPQGAIGGSSSGLAGGGNITSPAAGGIVGLSCPIPTMVSFAGLMILILGNGLSPYQTDGTSGGTVALINNFTGAFPAWVATTSYSVNDVIQPDTSNGHTYICIQGGISGSTEPTFPTGTKQTINDNNIIWQENGSNAVIAPRGAAHAINHAGSLWLWNTHPTDTSDGLDGPSVLKMSDANNPNSWNPLNTAFVGKDDGQQGMGMASFTIAETGIAPEGSLVLFKEFSTYQVIGVFGASDFSIQLAQTNLGCIAPRTIQFVPGFGIVRLTHLGVAVFDGVRDRLISEEIRPYLFGGKNDIAEMDFSWAYTAKADLVVQPPMYVMAIPVLGNGGDGRLTRLCCYDLVMKAWTIVDMPWDGISAVSLLNIPGSQPLTVFGGWDDGMVSRWQAGDQQGWQAWLDVNLGVHAGTPLTWSLKPPSALGSTATDRLFFRRFLARGQWNGGVLNSISNPSSVPSTVFTAMVIVDGTTKTVGPLRQLNTPSGGQDSSFQLVVEIGINGLDCSVLLSGVQAIGGAPVEIDEDIFQVVQRPVGALARAG